MKLYIYFHRVVFANGVDYYRAEGFNVLEVKTCSDGLHSYKDHLHQELSIGYIEKGASILNVNGKDYYIKAREAVIIYPYVSHKCQPVDINNWAFTMIYIENDFCKGNLDNIYRKSSIGIKKLGDHEFDKIKNLSKILKSKANPFCKEVELTNALIELFNTRDIDISLGTGKKINSIKTYIEEHFLETLQLRDMEAKFDINKFALIRSFKSKFNTTPNAYQLQLKVDYGKSLLKNSDDIADIALKAGFYDQAHFTKEFKKAYGVTPLQYHKSIH